ncbi:hypothetical protein [Burkholderia sp. SCN-KJ]|uniref:hypothetical protein n=1 Tax=Burkholderia sp. SCN-KJ TaxID=2969248 RepID=UPI00215043D4|nr:hypothetical protein [Burkholderia sp. SCN-KJ]MCR4470460.1 hypothetical protein [Burkholderia sp. SCN-KJ]
MEIDMLGIDLTKQVFQLHSADRGDRTAHRVKVSRRALLEFVRTLKPSMVIMEARRGATNGPGGARRRASKVG